MYSTKANATLSPSATTIDGASSMSFVESAPPPALRPSATKPLATVWLSARHPVMTHANTPKSITFRMRAAGTLRLSSSAQNRAESARLITTKSAKTV